MKKDTAIKKLTTLHNQFIDTIQKIRDHLYTIEDPELCDQVDDWCDRFEEFIDDEGSIEELVESIEEIYSLEEA